MSERPAQLTLGLPHRISHATADFLVADCNRAAVAWVDRWPHWPAPVLILFGPAGSGKSHLTTRFVRRSGAQAVSWPTLAETAPHDLLAHAPALALEDMDAALSPDLERPVLHLINSVREQVKTMLLTTRTPPARWGIRLADLRSRLLAAPAVGIAAPDETLLRAVLVKLFDDRQLAVREDLLDYVLARMERSFAAAHDLVARLDTASLSGGRPITVPLARSVLAENDTP